VPFTYPTFNPGVTGRGQTPFALVGSTRVKVTLCALEIRRGETFHEVVEIREAQIDALDHFIGVHEKRLVWIRARPIAESALGRLDEEDVAIRVLEVSRLATRLDL